MNPKESNSQTNLTTEIDNTYRKLKTILETDGVGSDQFMAFMDLTRDITLEKDLEIQYEILPVRQFLFVKVPRVDTELNRLGQQYALHRQLIHTRMTENPLTYAPAIIQLEKLKNELLELYGHQVKYPTSTLFDIFSDICKWYINGKQKGEYPYWENLQIDMK